MQPNQPSPTPKPLTRIELALLQALATGASNKALAQRLGKSSHTVRNQLSALFAKIGVANRTQALVWYQAQAHARLAGTGAPAVTPANQATNPPVSFSRALGTSVLLPSVVPLGNMRVYATPATPPAAIRVQLRPRAGR
jgi:DNA-binding CsgD family transcriptional regulator